MNSSLEGNHSVLENTFVFLEPSTSKEEQLDDNESLKVDDILIQEPDLTADAKPQKEEFLENLNDNLDDEFKNLINKVTNEEEQQKLSFKSEVETIAPIEITKSECKYCAYCKLFCYFKKRALLHAPREITSKQTNAVAAA